MKHHHKIEKHNSITMNKFNVCTNFILAPNLTSIPVATIMLRTKNKTRPSPNFEGKPYNLLVFWAKWTEINKKDKGIFF